MYNYINSTSCQANAVNEALLAISLGDNNIQLIQPQSMADDGTNVG